MVYLQEFFGSKDDDETLVQKLKESGFVRVSNWKTPTYRTEGVFVNVQRINSENHVARSNPVPWGFVMELNYPLAEYSADHPLRTFFAKLEEPKAYGLGLTGGRPRNQAEEYLPPQQAAVV